MRAFSRSYGVLALAALLSATGCLRKEVTHTIYIGPAEVTWSAVEKDVRSDESDPGNRMMEEHGYLLDARAGRHGVARTLQALGSPRVTTNVLRDDRPFTVLTRAEFRDPAELAKAMLAAARVRGGASMERDACERTFRAWIDPDNDGGEDANALTELLSDATSYRLVLTDGRFLRAEGFTIEQDGAIATLGAPVENQDGILRVSLTWNESWCAAGR